MSLIPIKIPPGISRNGTDYENQGRWYDADLVRFSEGVLRPIPGWSKIADDPVDGVPRGLLAWKDEDGDRWIGIGTTEGLFVFSGGAYVDITPVGFTAGAEDAVSSDGYGGGSYGSGGYGSPRILADVTPASTWTLDNWGQYLVACMAGDGGIYQWDVDPMNVATIVPNAPTGCKGCFVTPERHLVAFGAGGNSRLVAWSSQEDIDDWTPSAANTAGSQELQTSGTILAAIKGRGETLLLTEADAWVMSYLGGQLVYGFERAADAAGIAGPKAGVAVDGSIFFMGKNAFFVYSGRVQQLPCEVHDYVFSDINKTQISKVYACHVAAYGEVWWFYPSGESNEIDRYVIYNYREGHWMIGQGIARTAWEDASVYDYPVAADVDGYLYQHESGWTADGVALTAARRIRSGPVEIQPGNQVMSVRYMHPDEKTQGQAKINLYSKFTPEGAYASHGPYTLTGYTDARITGRQIAVEIVGNVDNDWRFGTLRLDVVAGSRR